MGYTYVGRVWDTRYDRVEEERSRGRGRGGEGERGRGGEGKEDYAHYIYR